MRLLLLAALAAAASAASLQGVATQFGGPEDKQNQTEASGGLVDNACGYGYMNRTMFPFWRGAGISPKSALLKSSPNKLGCGSCVKVTCDPARQLPFSPCKAGALPVTVMIIDECPKCADNQINIHASAFSEFLGSVPRVAVTLDPVPCDPQQALWIKVTDARPTAGGFVRLALQGVAGDGSVAAVDVRPTGSAAGWTPAQNAFGASWQASKFGDGVTSLDVRVTGGSPGSTPVVAEGAISPFKKGTFGSAVQVNNGATAPGPAKVAAVAAAPASAPPAPAAPTPAAATPAKASSAPAPAPAAPAVEEPKPTPAANPEPAAKGQALAVSPPRDGPPGVDRAVADILAASGLRAGGGR